MNEQPMVTVLMPVFNGQEYIADALRSVLSQTFQHFELLIVNDGSTDHTVPIISGFKDARIRIVNTGSRTGIAAALNLGMSLAKGKYVARFDADDLCFPGRLALQLGFLSAQPDYVAVGSDAEYIDKKGSHLFHFTCAAHSDEEIAKIMTVRCPFIHSSVMFRREAVLAAGGYCVLAHNFEDHLLWVQLKQFGKFHNISLPLIKVRINPSSVTIDERHRGRVFGKLKHSALSRGYVTPAEGMRLSAIIERQNRRRIKESSYHSLCAKKYLLNNHQPGKARASLLRAIVINPLRLDNYALYALSFFPASLIHHLHHAQLSKFRTS